MPPPIFSSSIEARLLILTKTPKNGEEHTDWELANRPGAPLTLNQVPQQPFPVFSSGSETSHVVTALTKILNEEAFQAQDTGNFCDTDAHWTRWYSGGGSVSLDLYTSADDWIGNY